MLGPARSTPLALERAGLTMGDLTLIDMHEAFAAQTLANIQLLGSERFARDVLGVHMPLAKWTRANLTCLAVRLLMGIPSQRPARG